MLPSSSAGASSAVGPRADLRPWHAGPASELVREFETDPERGLSASEAAQRLRRYGLNRPGATKPEPWWHEVLEELREPMILLLLAVGGAYLVLGERRDALAVLAITAIILGVELVTEYRAKRAISALRALSSPTAPVIRDGEPREVAPQTLVPGDLVLLRSGERVPADLRLLEASGLRVDESPLTGESSAVLKRAEAEIPAKTELGDRLTMTYAGTLVVGGKGRGVVVATGVASELGRIGALVAEVREARTPLQVEMRQLAASLVWVALGFSVVLPILGVFLAGMPVPDAVLSGLTLAFATIPEELPLLITIVLALGALQLARRNAFVKRLIAAETLGAVTVICTDKTGTLTRNEMKVRTAWVDGRALATSELQHDPTGRRLLLAAVLANDAQLLRRDGRLQFQGDPTETALLELAEQGRINVDTLRASADVVEEWPFEERRKRMSVLYRIDGELRLAMKGAAESVLAVAVSRATESGIGPLDETARAQIRGEVERMAGQGLRVLALADRQDIKAAAPSEEAVTFLGLLALEDPLRSEARAAIDEVRGAGIRVLMLTGDHPATARAISEQVGLDSAEVLVGLEVDRLSDADLRAALDTTSVFARIAPEHKLRIVQALQRSGEVVAVTGDGVNDAPALKQAAIGVAMGRSGSDVAKETADLILADDNFATIALAVHEGRKLYANLRKAVAFYLAAKLALVLASLVAVLAAAPLPFAPIQLILMELFMDLFASITFTAEPAEGGLMRQRPRGLRARFLDAPLMRRIAVGGLALGAAVAVSYLVAWLGGGDQRVAQTSAFVTWMIGHATLALIMRSERGFSLGRSVASNRPYLVWVALAVVVVAAAQAVPAVATLLHAAALAPTALLVSIGLGALVPFAALLGRFSANLPARQAKESP